MGATFSFNDMVTFSFLNPLLTLNYLYNICIITFVIIRDYLFSLFSSNGFNFIRTGKIRKKTKSCS